LYTETFKTERPLDNTPNSLTLQVC
jgi:hypothetical protein